MAATDVTAWLGKTVCRRATNTDGLGGTPWSWTNRRGGSGGGTRSGRRGTMGGVESSVGSGGSSCVGGGGLISESVIDKLGPCDEPRRR